MEILKEYYKGIQTRLKAEVDLINNLVPHSATKGTLNEDSIKKIIEDFMPEKYSVGSGVIIDSFGNRSGQIDIIIYDNHSYPNIFKSSSMFLFPVEIVVATIEVKTKLTSDSLEKAINTFSLVNKLRHTRIKFSVSDLQEKCLIR